MLQMLAVNQYVLGITVVGFVVASVSMILIVLVQRPQGGGLSDAFGAGAGGGGTAFGAKTGDALTTGTIGVFILFLALAISLNFMIRPGVAQLQQAEVSSTTPAGQTPAAQVINEDGNTIELTPTENPFTSLPAELEGAADDASTELPAELPAETPATDTPVETPEDPQ